MTTERKAVELKPCPFCGGAGQVVTRRPPPAIGDSGMEPSIVLAGCDHCGVLFTGGYTERWTAEKRWHNTKQESEAKAIAAWNTRALESAGQGEAQGDALRAMADMLDPTKQADTLRRFVDRFLAWPLPDSVHPYGSGPAGEYREAYGHPRTGTDLLTANEALMMFEHCVGSCLDCGQTAGHAPGCVESIFPPQQPEAQVPGIVSAYCCVNGCKYMEQPEAQAGGVVAAGFVSAKALADLERKGFAVLRPNRVHESEVALYTAPPAQVPEGDK